MNSIKMKTPKLLAILLFLFSCFFVQAQSPKKVSSNQIYEKIQKLNFLGTALYLAAHPDDENTRLIAYLSNKVHARTGYLSLTRGDGGQNLIGSEIRELLGVIRTQELLAARNVDGGQQFFSRANDFGFSKQPEETFEFWNKKDVLADVVWVIRNFKPDVIINRFDHRTPGTTHGHHTASAMLSVDAFDLAADKNQFSSQMQYTSTWQPKRLFFNTSWWFYGSKEKFEKADKSKMFSVDVGNYYPLKGLSNNELASLASSQHLCQGFGRLTVRGSQEEWLELIKGDLPTKQDIFEGINTTWSRVKGGEKIGEILYEVEENFDFTNPSIHLPELMKAYQFIQNLEDSHWRKIKEKEIKEIILACGGLYLEASANASYTTPNSEVELAIETLNRSEKTIKLTSVEMIPIKETIRKQINLLPNKKEEFKQKITIKNTDYSDPYWLKKPWSLGMYTVDNQKLIGNPETLRPLQIRFNLVISGIPISFTKNVIHRYAKRDKGEIYEPFEILPEITTKLKDKVLLFGSNQPKKITIQVDAHKNNVSGEVTLQLPKNWKASPSKQTFSIAHKGDAQPLEFTVTPPKNQSEGKLRVVATSEGKTYHQELVEINYEHIPKQSVLLTSEAKLVKLNIQKSGDNIAYIQGSGDAIPTSLRQIGYKVDEIEIANISAEKLSNYDAVVVGIRAYNTQKDLQFKQKYLLDYVKNGGNLIVQYNTNRNVDVRAPFPLQLSRDRVTDEQAKVTFLSKNHPLLNYPNAITAQDFEGWVQERGLYFSNKWDKAYTPILSMNDKNEKAKKGSLLIAKYGKGNYIYTGLSFFRELPAGVPGAYKLFVNMLSVGKSKK